MDKIFARALLVSFLGHLLLFLPWPGIKNRLSSNKFSEIEINYFEIRPKIEEIKIIKTTPPEEKKTELKEGKIIEEEKVVQLVKREEKVSPQITKEEEWVKRDFSNLSKEPVFLDYYRAIREKIKNSANRNKPLFFKPGEVCVFFVLDNKGNLKRLKIIDSKTTEDPLLREIALKSIEEASPFPPFPKELKREQIAFNIIIAFEIR